MNRALLETKPETVLEVRGLHTHLGPADNPVRAVDGVDLCLQRGETFVLVGESGCGKSMIALSMMRLLPPSGRVVQGEVMLHGKSLLDLPEVEMRRERGGGIGMIFQEPMTSLNPVMTVGRQVAEAVRLHDPQHARNPRVRVLELFRLVGIPDPERRIDEYPHQLSGGMKQRVMIAMALAGRPAVLIADEPTTALDVTIQAQVLQLLRDLQQETGMAVLLITHDLGVVAEMADRVGVMYAGQLVETAPVAGFFERPRHPYSRKLFRSLPDAGKRERGLDVIKGMVPSLDRPFTLCRFRDRCEAAQPVCGEGLPPWQGDARNGYRCHLAIDDIQLQQADLTLTATAPAATQPLMQARGLQVHFPIRRGVLRRTVGHVKAVDGVDMALHAGRTLALVGESGCGKTTVGKALLQLLRPTGGSVEFDGIELTGLRGEPLRRLRRAFQIIFQDPASSMNPRMLVGDIVAEGMRAQGIGGDRNAQRERVAALLDQVGLPESATQRYPHEFSGGQRQRIAIARALAVEPRLIVCDEPTSALDVSVQAQVLNLLKALQAELGLAYLFITHNIAVVAYLADEVAVMYLGRIVEQGPVGRILEAPAHPYTEALLASVPVPDPTHQREVLRLEGDMPSPAHPPAGCHFHERCPRALPRCREAYPPSVQLDELHRVACWLHVD
jgi:peptide/nickel transport system ATP-binding protein